ncbi:MAG: bifunctional adenosylcobinamide kinase/adenosylcobinamide-phosphate guanylyltransferase [Eubacteriaceae bacterium]|nr:bifunctional adenosylcobinamide kinase/adenosylcobinamide-phosphate guanylyltransferase [Eubacteriaceae bacterium]
MILVFGGAYQGKKEFVATKFGYSLEDMYQCTEKDEIDFSKPVITDLGSYVLGAIRRGENPLNFVLSNKAKFKDKIIVITDVGSGIVPISKEQRLFRDNIGKITQILSRESTEVYRLFCGIGEKLK